MEFFYIDIFNLSISPYLALLFFFAYTWTTKTDNVTNVVAADINLLQTEKLDRDGEIECTGTMQWDKGANIASAATLVPGNDGNYFNVTGTTGITAINATQSQPGTVIKLHFNDAVVITHHATNLIMPGGVNYTTQAGDELEFVEYATDDWRCTNISTPDPIFDDLTTDKILINETATFDGEYNIGSKNANFAIDWNNGQNQKVTITGANLQITFTAPTTGVGKFFLKIIQGDGDDTIDWPNCTPKPNFSNSGTSPTLSTGAGEIDFVAFYWDGAALFGLANMDFAPAT